MLENGMSRDAAKVIMEVVTRNVAEQDVALAQIRPCVPKMSFANTGA
jgi:hypothetical protein